MPVTTAPPLVVNYVQRRLLDDTDSTYHGDAANGADGGDALYGLLFHPIAGDSMPPPQAAGAADGTTSPSPTSSTHAPQAEFLPHVQAAVHIIPSQFATSEVVITARTTACVP